MNVLYDQSDFAESRSDRCLITFAIAASVVRYVTFS